MDVLHTAGHHVLRIKDLPRHPHTTTGRHVSSRRTAQGDSKQPVPHRQHGLNITLIRNLNTHPPHKTTKHEAEFALLFSTAFF